MRFVISLALIAVAVIVVASRLRRALTGRRSAPPPAPSMAARVRFALGLVLLGLAAVLSVLDVEPVVTASAYIGGLALLVNGYLDGRFTRRRPPRAG